MELSTRLEFGDFENKIEQVYLHDDCVELPTSWTFKDSGAYKLSFCLPNLSDRVSMDEIHSSNAQSDTSTNRTTDPDVPDVVVPIVYNGLKATPSITPDQNINEVEASDATQSNTQCNEPSANSMDTETNEVEEPEKHLTNELSKNTNTPADNALNGHVSDDELRTIDNVEISKQDAALSPNQDDIETSSQNILIDDDNDNQTDLTSQTNTENKRTTDDSENKNIKTEPVVPEPALNEQQKAKPQTSWAGLFRGNTNSPSNVQQHSQVNGHSEKLTNKQSGGKVTNHITEIRKPSAKDKPEPEIIKFVQTDEDPDAKFLAERLLNMELIFKPQAFIPRGLINISNWCYINATLQALLVCPPFYQLLKNLPPISSGKRMETSTPIMDSFIRLASEFRPLSTKRGYQSSKEIRQGTPFEPRYIYDMLTVIKSSLSERGSQEDAEEFQSCILNGLHEEMTKLFNYLNDSGISSPKQDDREMENGNGIYQESFYENMLNGDCDEATSAEWEEVVATKKNRTAITRRADVSRTPISDMFRGEMCTCVSRPGQKMSVSFEPFFSLPLDVPTEHTHHAWTIEDALYSMTLKEEIVETEPSDAARQQTIEILPPVLILHLKRFVYDKNGGSKKIDKKMEYKTDLVIGKDLLSKSARKQGIAQRSYKLFAVVYHHGEKATGGHYTTDVFHIGLSSWLRIDDQSIWPVPHNEVTRHNSTRTAYLLYYRRTDLG